MLTDAQIIEVAGTQCAVPGSYAHALARAIESAACAPLLERIAELEAKVSEAEQACRWETDLCEQLISEMESMKAKLAQRVVPDVDALTDKIASLLGLTYHCTRVWEAWYVGTMSQDDFEPVDESETPREIAEEILAMLAAAPAAPEQQEPNHYDQATEFVWLVEHFLGDGSGNSTGFYHTGFTDLGGNSRTTKDPMLARRYKTQSFAEAAAEQLGTTLNGTWKAVQHGFMQSAAVGQAPNAQQAEAQPMAWSDFRACFCALSGLLEQVETFCSKHGEAEFETGEALAAVERCMKHDGQFGATAQPKAVPLTDEQIDEAAKVLSHCMDYPWSHMSEAGRVNMRKNAKMVIESAIGAPAKKGGE